MTWRPAHALPLVLLFWLCAAARAQGIEENGPDMNGIHIGTDAKADPKQERGLRVVRLRDGVTLADGSRLSDVVVKGSALLSPSRGGASFVGARLVGLTTYGQPLRLRIEAIDRAKDDVVLYRVAYQAGATFTPLCAGTERAIAVAGRWDYHRGEPGHSGKRSSEPSELTLACQPSAIGKCIERLGYKPWQSSQLDELHQACVRALRADYCGDGRSGTTAGQRVNVYDTVGVQKDEADWDFEGAWSGQGPRCLHYGRLLQAGRVAGVDLKGYFGAQCKARPPTCGAARGGAGEGAVLRTEISP